MASLGCFIPDLALLICDLCQDYILETPGPSPCICLSFTLGNESFPSGRPHLAFDVLIYACPTTRALPLLPSSLFLFCVPDQNLNILVFPGLFV